jgi:protein lifeguard
MEAFTLGVVTAFYDNVIVLQALLITTGVFLGLTLFTLQSKVCMYFAFFMQRNDVHLKYDFSGMGPWLFGGLLALGKVLCSSTPGTPYLKIWQL